MIYMCGITGYVGYRNAFPVLVDTLKRLEYRGYDSAGFATVNESINIVKDAGRIDDVISCVKKSYFASVGIAHTRWATHGKPTKNNAHPHTDCKGKVAVVHNGIIENFMELKEELKNKHVLR